MHEHHRDRLRDKALTEVSVLNDYELLELILFGVVPRRNTNDIAHRLIDEFGSLKGVFSVSTETLQRIDGVGKIVAAHIAVMGKIINKVADAKDNFPDRFSFEAVKKSLAEYFSAYKEEVFLVFFLDKNQFIKNRMNFFGRSTSEVVIDINEFSRQLVSNKSEYIAIAHNHLSGNVLPSVADDRATQKLCITATALGAPLIDHIIVSNDKFYSYYYEGRLDKIREKIRETGDTPLPD